MRLGPIEEEAAQLLISDVQSVVGKRYPHNPLLVIGSYSTGLADRLSDFDFNLSFPEYEKQPLDRGPSPTRIKARKAGGRALINMQHTLERSGRFSKGVELIHARVPIVKAEHRATQAKVELQTLSSQRNTREYVASYLAEFPTLRTLYIVIRSALHIRYLTNVHKGGLGSYSIFVMIVNALKHASGKYANDDLANHFLHVLDFYGNADLYKYGFSPDPPRKILKQGKKMSAKEKNARLQDPVLRGIDILEPYQRQKPYLLFLQDPANAINDLGRKAYGIKHVQCILGHFAESLRETMRRSDEGDRSTHNWLRTHGLLANLLEANYKPLESHRQRMRKWVVKKKATLGDAIDNGLLIRGTGRNGSSSISTMEHEPQAEAPWNITETPSGELRVVGSESALEGSGASSTQEGNEALGRSTAKTSNSRREKQIPLPAMERQQTPSQDILKHTIRRDPSATNANTQEGTGPKPPANSGWRRWTPLQEENTPKTKDGTILEGKDESTSEKTDCNHATLVLRRFQKNVDKSTFERLKDMDWPTLVRLTGKDLDGLGLTTPGWKANILRVRWV